MENTVQTLPDSVIFSLGQHVRSCFDEALRHKRSLHERLLKCYRQRKGLYEPDLEATIKQTGMQPVFIMLSDIKCRAAEAWIRDVMQNHNESTWAMSPTAEPELPPEILQEIEGVVLQEAAAVAAMGVVVEDEALDARKEEILEEAATRIRERAAERCKRMETRIVDKLQEGRWRVSMGETINDFTTFPAAIIKAPVLRRKPRMKWGPNFQPIVTKEVVMDVDRVSPFDAFPSPNAVSIQDGYFIHRQRLTRASLVAMRGMAGVNDEAISEILNTNPKGYKATNPGDSAQEALIGGQAVWSTPGGLYETLEYWGPASGEMLIEWGLKRHAGERIDPEAEYQINCWSIAGTVFKAIINPDPMGRRPYSKACFNEIPGSFWGTALPELMSDVQTMVNASARALAHNMGIASGPQVEVNYDRLPDGATVTSMYPWKVWPTKTDRNNGQPAVRFFQPSMNASELMGVFQNFMRAADEATGVPNYIYGSAQGSGAGRTAAGLSMLMENAAKGIKHAILALDAAHAEIVGRIYEHLMLHDPDESIKGDMQVVAAGAIGALIREQQMQARREFMAETLNPVDAQIIGMQGRAYMLRETAKNLFPDINKIVPDPDKQRLMQAMQQAAVAQQSAMAPPGGPGMPGPAGPMGVPGPVAPPMQ